MDTDFSWPILAAGAARSCIWFAGAALAYYRRRWMVTAGMTGAGLTAIPFALLSANAHLPQVVIDIAAYTATPVVLLLVGGFMVHQPKHAPRPPRWTP